MKSEKTTYRSRSRVLLITALCCLVVSGCGVEGLFKSFVKNKVCPERGENVEVAESKTLKVIFENAKTGEREEGIMETWPGDRLVRPSLQIYEEK